MLAFCLGHQVVAQALGGLVQPAVGSDRHYALQESELLLPPAECSSSSSYAPLDVVRDAVVAVRRRNGGHGDGNGGDDGGREGKELSPSVSPPPPAPPLRLLYHHNDEVSHHSRSLLRHDVIVMPLLSLWWLRWMKAATLFCIWQQKLSRELMEVSSAFVFRRMCAQALKRLLSKAKKKFYRKVLTL